MAIPFQITCGTCEPCRRGHTASCDGVKPRRAMYGLAPICRHDWGGAMSDRVLVPHAEAMLVPMPAGLDPVSVASLSDNLPDAWRTVGPPLEAFAGGSASVLVVGGGAPSIGLYAVGFAAALGAEVTYVDTSASRLSIAASLGATVVEGPPPAREGRHLVTVDASASVEGLHCAIRSTAGDGVCTSVGIYYQNEVPVPLLEMYTNNITFVTGRCSARPAMPRILELVTSGKLHPEVVTTSVVKWDEAIAALAEPFTKLMMVP